MKTSIIVLILLIGLLLSCAKDGEIGPQGSKGDTGATGQDGQNGQDGADGAPGSPGASGTSANVWTYIYTNQRIGADGAGIFDPITNSYIFSGSKEYAPANYEQIQNAGVVLVYFRMSGVGSWKLGSYQIGIANDGTGNSGEVKVSYIQDFKFVSVRSQFLAAQDDGAEMEKAQFDLKIILVESSSVTMSILRSKAPAMEINEVERYLKSIAKN